MLKKLRNRIEEKRYSENLLWRGAVLCKDMLWNSVTTLNLNYRRGYYGHYKNSDFRKYILSKPPKELTLPDFLGIGAQKSATSWLHQQLIKHPEIYLPEQKEIHYFDKHPSASLAWYSYHFKEGVSKIKGEITPGYAILPLKKIKLIKKIMPNAKLIYLLRNPIDRAWSHALMDLVRRKNRRFEEISKSEFYAHFKSKNNSMVRGDYLTCINNWLSVFPKNQLYIGFFDEIISQPKKILKEILKHIDVSPFILLTPSLK